MSKEWIEEASRVRYFHELTWLGRPIIQVPQDMYAIQEIIWKINPDLIIETGIAHGGSLIFSASMLALLDFRDAKLNGVQLNLNKSQRKVIGIDIDIRKHNLQALKEHYLYHYLDLIEGSSIDPVIVDKVKDIANNYRDKKILVLLDSNHTHDHVLAELNAYANLASEGSYCVVFDTGVEDLPAGFYKDRPWDKGNNPMTAVFEYMKSPEGEKKFKIDKEIEEKILITAAPNGFLRKINL